MNIYNDDGTLMLAKLSEDGIFSAYGKAYEDYSFNLYNSHILDLRYNRYSTGDQIYLGPIVFLQMLSSVYPDRGNSFLGVDSEIKFDIAYNTKSVIIECFKLLDYRFYDEYLTLSKDCNNINNDAYNVRKSAHSFNDGLSQNVTESLIQPSLNFDTFHTINLAEPGVYYV